MKFVEINMNVYESILNQVASWSFKASDRFLDNVLIPTCPSFMNPISIFSLAPNATTIIL